MIAADSLIASSSKRKGRRKKASVNKKQQEDDGSRSFSVNFCVSEKVIEIRRPRTSPVTEELIGKECHSAITSATLQFEEICGSKFTWDEPIVDSPDADDANSVMNCLLVSHDKIGCQLIIEPVCEEEFHHHAYL
jgi:hypothetical protein